MLIDSIALLFLKARPQTYRAGLINVNSRVPSPEQSLERTVELVTE